MSEGIIIALITVIGSSLGGIIGELIAAKAVKDAAAIKEKLNQAPNVRGEKSNNWTSILGGALTGAVATIIILFLLGMIPPKPENSPVATPTDKTPISKTQTPATISSNSAILFDEDFEDGKVQQVTHITNGWSIASDETGNQVYEIDNSKGSGTPRIYLGTENWKDYELKFLMRFMDNTTKSGTIIEFRCGKNCLDKYVVSITSEETGLYYTTQGYGWKIITSQEYPLKQNNWYLVSIRAIGSEVKVSINDKVVIFTDDTRYTSGDVNIQADQYTHMQLDDIQVTSLEK